MQDSEQLGKKVARVSILQIDPSAKGLEAGILENSIVWRFADSNGDYAGFSNLPIQVELL